MFINMYSTTYIMILCMYGFVYDEPDTKGRELLRLHNPRAYPKKHFLGPNSVKYYGNKIK